jgi:hypothetical protein
MVGWTFPRQEEHYDRYLTFRNAQPAEYERWRKSLVWFLKKVVLKYNCCRPLLKSPQHTARIALLLDQFPNAKFVHVQRNPYVVFRSTQRLYETGILPNALQVTRGTEYATEGILRRYKDMYDAFFEDRKLIPAGNYAEVTFEELEHDIVRTIARVFDAVRLDGYAQLEPKLEEFVELRKDHQKNKHPEIEESLRRRIYSTWQRAFDEFGYPA